MTRKFLNATAAAAIAVVSGAAWAQQDSNNPAPTYPNSASSTPRTDAAPIKDGINGAPTYPSTAGSNPRTDAAPIKDGINGAPTYPSAASSTASSSTKQTKSAGKKSSGSVAHSKHHKPAHSS